ncbi:MAG: hypothetical protein ACK5XZ_09745 [Hyphomonadaceae bacterium]|jgi:hypothetical protein
MSEARADDDVWEMFCDGPVASIWMNKHCLAAFLTLPLRDQAKIQATMEKMYCTMENVSIPPKKLNFDEGRHDGLQVWAFKEKQSRVYGVQGSINAKRTFFATNVAVKKAQKADPGDLSKASRLAQKANRRVAGARV